MNFWATSSPESREGDSTKNGESLSHYFSALLKGDCQRNGLPDLPAGYSRGQVVFDDDAHMILRHGVTGVMVWSKPFQVEADCDNVFVLYLYLKWSALRSFVSAGSWKEWLRTSWSKDGVVSMMASPPDKFETKEAILVNIYTNARDQKEQETTISKFQGNADYCLPFLIPRNDAYDAMREYVPGVAHGPGYNRRGEALRSDRDIWVVNLTGSELTGREDTLRRADANPFDGPRTALRRAEPKVDRELSRHLELMRAMRNAEDSDPYIRRMSAQLMGKHVTVDDPDLIRALEKLTQDKDEMVMLAARQALFNVTLQRQNIGSDDDPETNVNVEVDERFIHRHLEGRRQAVAPMEIPKQPIKELTATEPEPMFPIWQAIGGYLGFSCNTCETDGTNMLCASKADQHEFSLIEQSHFAAASLSEQESDGTLYVSASASTSVKTSV